MNPLEIKVISLDEKTIKACMGKLCEGCRNELPLVKTGVRSPWNCKMHLEKTEGSEIRTFCRCLPLYDLLKDKPQSIWSNVVLLLERLIQHRS